MKKLLVTILCLLCLLCVFTACAHECSWSSEWTADENNHWHECTDENCIEVNGLAPHSGGQATCSQKAECSVCGEQYGQLTEHTPGTPVEEILQEATCITQGSKMVVISCTECGEMISSETTNFYADHVGGVATCTTKAICTLCEQPYGELDATNHSGELAGYVANNDGTHNRAYNCCQQIVTENCSGGEANCTNKAVCEFCNVAYGELDATNHVQGQSVYTDNGDGTHKVVATCCNKETNEDHIYVWDKTNEAYDIRVCEKCGNIDQQSKFNKVIDIAPKTIDLTVESIGVYLDGAAFTSLGYETFAVNMNYRIGDISWGAGVHMGTLKLEGETRQQVIDNKQLHGYTYLICTTLDATYKEPHEVKYPVLIITGYINTYQDWFDKIYPHDGDKYGCYKLGNFQPQLSNNDWQANVTIGGQALGSGYPTATGAFKGTFIGNGAYAIRATQHYGRSVFGNLDGATIVDCLIIDNTMTGPRTDGRALLGGYMKNTTLKGVTIWINAPAVANGVSDQPGAGWLVSGEVSNNVIADLKIQVNSATVNVIPTIFGNQFVNNDVSNITIVAKDSSITVPPVAQVGQYTDGDTTVVIGLCDVNNNGQHTFGTAYGKDDTQHWNTCSICGKADQSTMANHTWDDANGKVTTQATCTEAGVRTWTCTVCGHTKTEAISATGHTEVVDQAVSATCTTAGKTEGKHCSVCETVIVAQTEVAKLAHTEQDIPAVSATCSATGLTAGKKCSVCGEILTAQTEVAKLAHTEVVDEAVAPTCTEKGKKEGKHCSVCNEVILAQEEIPALGHTYGTEIALVPATCETAGTKAHYKCSTCEKLFVKEGENYVEKQSADLVITALGHTYGTEIAEVPATCTTVGTKAHYKCSVCDKLFVKEGENYVEKQSTDLVIEKIAHNYGTEIAKVDATCTEDGKNAHYKCSVCEKLFVKSGETYSEVQEVELVISASGHTYGTEIALVPATCETAGTKAHYKCSTCEKLFVKEGENYVEKQSADLVITALGHTYGTEIAKVDATCMVAGKLAYYECSACDKLFVKDGDNYVEKSATELVIPVDTTNGHAWAQTWSKDSATHWHACTNTGCTAKNEEVAHSNATATDCTVEVACDVCEQSFRANHSVDLDTKVDAKAPTCTEDGNPEYYSCANCDSKVNAQGQTVNPVTPATGHTYGSLVDEAPATCIATGLEAHYRCTVCEAYFVSDIDTSNKFATATTVEALTIDINENAHDWNEWAVVEGNHVRTCKRDETHTDTHAPAFGDYSVSAGKHVHTCTCGISESHDPAFGEWAVGTGDYTGKHVRTCTCGIVDGHDPVARADDGNCTTDILCQHCTLVVTEGADAHDYTDQAWTANGTNHEQKCANCDYKQSHTASFGQWAVDGDDHKRTCQDCTLSETHDPAFGDWSVGTGDYAGKHVRTCTCNLVDSHVIEAGTDDGNCLTAVLCKHDCGLVATEAKSAHDYTSQAWTANDANHEQKCANCDYKQSHTASFGEWAVDGTNHKRTCQTCTYSETHAIEAEGEQTDCEVAVNCKHGCGLVAIPAKSHSYTWNNEASDKDVGTCACGDVVEVKKVIDTTRLTIVLNEADGDIYVGFSDTVIKEQTGITNLYAVDMDYHIGTFNWGTDVHIGNVHITGDDLTTLQGLTSLHGETYVDITVKGNYGEQHVIKYPVLIVTANITTKEEWMQYIYPASDDVYGYYQVTSSDLGLNSLTSAPADTTHAFKGTLVGGVSNAMVRVSQQYSRVMFGNLDGATIKNITIWEQTYTGSFTNGAKSGIIATNMVNTTLENITVVIKGLNTITNGSTGWLVGQNCSNNTIKNITIDFTQTVTDFAPLFGSKFDDNNVNGITIKTSEGIVAPSGIVVGKTTAGDVVTLCDANGVAHTPDATLSKDEAGHWYECTSCGAKTSYAVHSGTATDLGNGNHSMVCDCGFSSESTPHVYVWDKTDEKVDVGKCACGVEVTFDKYVDSWTEETYTRTNSWANYTIGTDGYFGIDNNLNNTATKDDGTLAFPRYQLISEFDFNLIDGDVAIPVTIGGVSVGSVTKTSGTINVGMSEALANDLKAHGYVDAIFTVTDIYGEPHEIKLPVLVITGTFSTEADWFKLIYPDTGDKYGCYLQTTPTGQSISFVDANWPEGYSAMPTAKGAFKGTVIGNGREIRGSHRYNRNLFGKLDGATIVNLSITDNSIGATQNGRSLLAASMINTRLIGVSIYASKHEDYNDGGTYGWLVSGECTGNTINIKQITYGGAVTTVPLMFGSDCDDNTITITNALPANTTVYPLVGKTSDGVEITICDAMGKHTGTAGSVCTVCGETIEGHV